MIQKYVRILLVLGMAAVMCGAVSAAMGIVAETHETSGVEAPACSAPCECISETDAIQRWGTTGYDFCSKTICGQSADAMVQYHCIHPIGGSAAPAGTVAQAPPAQAPAAPAAAATQKSPVHAVTVLAAIGAVLLASAAMRRK